MRGDVSNLLFRCWTMLEADEMIADFDIQN